MKNFKKTIGRFEIELTLYRRKIMEDSANFEYTIFENGKRILGSSTDDSCHDPFYVWHCLEKMNESEVEDLIKRFFNNRHERNSYEVEDIHGVNRYLQYLLDSRETESPSLELMFINQASDGTIYAYETKTRAESFKENYVMSSAVKPCAKELADFFINRYESGEARGFNTLGEAISDSAFRKSRVQVGIPYQIVNAA